jgi:hypothetical protein
MSGGRVNGSATWWNRKTETAYNYLDDTLTDARRARVIDVDAFRDDGLTRNSITAWSGVDEFKKNVGYWVDDYRRDRTEGQDSKLMLWCEAGGMVPQLERVAHPYGVEVLSSGGFDSLTVKHNFGRELAGEDRPVTVLHVGDLDPSGVHMALNIKEDVMAFAEEYGGQVEFYRLAVTPDQVDELGLETAPPKATDRRAFEGETCQAEDIAPDDLARIVEQGIRDHTDLEVLEELKAEEEEDRETLREWLGGNDE